MNILKNFNLKDEDAIKKLLFRKVRKSDCFLNCTTSNRSVKFFFGALF